MNDDIMEYIRCLGIKFMVEDGIIKVKWQHGDKHYIVPFSGLLELWEKYEEQEHVEKRKAHPPSTKIVIFWTKDGEKHHGFFMTRGNKFTPITNRWKDASTEKWYDDDEIINWKYFEHYPYDD